jgi:hypothetical protein
VRNETSETIILQWISVILILSVEKINLYAWQKKKKFQDWIINESERKNSLIHRLKQEYFETDKL